MLSPFSRWPALPSFCTQALRAFLDADQQASRVTIWWLGKFQSGCLSFGSLLTTVQRQSAIRRRLVAARPSAASALWRRGKPQHLASHSHGLWPSLPGVCQLCGELGRQQATSFSEPARLSAGCEYSPVGQVPGYQAELLLFKGSFGVPRSNICQQSKACLFSQAVASRPSLTCRSSRHPKVSLVGSLRASRSGAAYLWR
jgi:hypothetical protein